jgi:membrane protein DedA with SNARE-associated domain
MFVVAFGESLVFVSLLFPGTALLIAAGALTPGDALPIASLLTGAVLGAIAGDGVSFWIGRRFGHALNQVWPFTRHPQLIPSGISFFQRHGGKSVFIGRFFGPVRATIPLAAGILKMPT